MNQYEEFKSSSANDDKYSIWEGGGVMSVEL
jgi:hypothetical protein